MWIGSLDLIGLALAAAGTLLLGREVWVAHGVEALSREVDELRDLLSVYRLNPREFLVRNYMYGSHMSRAAATQAVDLVGDIPAKATQAFSALDAQARQGVERWYSRTMPSALALRRRLLFLGVALIELGFGAEFLARAGL